MSLIDKLTPKEKDMIGTYIDYYACDDTGRSASVDYLLRFWDQNKDKYLSLIFDGKLQLTKEITFTQDAEETFEEVRKAVLHNEAANAFLNEWRRRFGWYDYDDDLTIEVKCCLYEMVGWETLVSNRWDKETFIVPFPDGTSFKVQRGTKISKAIGKIVKGFNMSEAGYEAFRIACSQGLNQKTLKGTLTLSIHPMDYMTMSDNECDWSSCMSWREQGCYRMGTVEMMNSPMVVVAYLTAEDSKLNFDNYQWNSKKWRELLIITPDIICNVLGYPYRNSFLSKAAIGWLKELAFEHAGWTYANDTPISWEQHVWFSPYDTDDKICVITDTYNMYNDFSDRNHYGYFARDIEGRLYINYSGPSECMSCGQEDPEIDEEGTLVGLCCEEVEYCEFCGARITRHSDSYWVDDMHICQFCMEDHTHEDIHEDTHLNDNLHAIALLSDDNRARHHAIYIPYTDWNWTCLSHYVKRLYGVHQFEWSPERFYVHVDDLTSEGLEQFYYTTGARNPDDLKALFEYEWYTPEYPLDLESGTEYSPDGEPLKW